MKRLLNRLLLRGLRLADLKPISDIPYGQWAAEQEFWKQTLTKQANQ
jgi:hypothetical protein